MLEMLKEGKIVTQSAAEDPIRLGQLHRWNRPLDNFRRLFTES